MKPQWIEYTGSDEQIAEIRNGFIFKDINGEQCNLIKKGCDFVSNEHLKNYLEFCKCIEILICKPHPYAKEIQQWALTGQPVWVRVTAKGSMNEFPELAEYLEKVEHIETYCTNIPDWNIHAAEYSFTPFEEEG